MPHLHCIPSLLVFQLLCKAPKLRIGVDLTIPQSKPWPNCCFATAAAANFEQADPGPILRSVPVHADRGRTEARWLATLGAARGYLGPLALGLKSLRELAGF